MQNRIIKFRAWDEDRKKMIYDFNSKYQLLQTEEGQFFCGNTMDNGDWQEPKLIQYTGYKDVKGKEIYEGDFDKRGLITFRNGSFVLVHNPTCGSEINGGSECKWDYLDSIIKTCDIEVIGNIYKNPELQYELLEKDSQYE